MADRAVSITIYLLLSGFALLCDFRHRPANIGAAKRCDQLKLVARGTVSTDVAGAVGHERIDRRQPPEVAVRRAERVANKKGYCEICRVHYDDMKLVRAFTNIIYMLFFLHWRN